MAERKIRMGILGAGGYGRTAREYLRHAGEFEIVACMDSVAGAAADAAKEEGARAYTELSAFLAHPDMEAVCINTPVLLHAEHSRRCLEAGKHVFITKPVTNAVADALAVERQASSGARVYMVAHHARHMPDANLIRQMVTEGRLGRVCNVLVTSCSSAGLVQKAGDWRVAPGQNPGGPLLQCGIHTLDTLLGIFGPVQSVMAMLQKDVTPFEVDDNALTLLEFQSGIQAAFVCNYTTAYMHTIDVFGTEANLHFHKHITGLHQMEVYLQRRAGGEHEPWEALRIPVDKSYPDPHGGVLEREFARQIRAGIPDYENLRCAIDALRIVEAAVESHRHGKRVILEP